MQPQSILLLPSEELGWDTLRKALAEVPQAQVVGEVTTIAGAAAAIPRLKPDLIIAAATLGGLCVASLLCTLRGDAALTGRVALIADRFSHECHDALATLDPDAILLWGDLTLGTLLPCLLLLLAGTIRLWSPRLSGAITHPSPNPVPVTPRERAVLDGMAAGLTQEQIATQACLSDRSVRRTVTELQGRFGVANTFALIARATALGYVNVRIRTAPWPDVDTNLSGFALVSPHVPPQTGETIVRIAARR